jgi:hypothetical protein
LNQVQSFANGSNKFASRLIKRIRDPDTLPRLNGPQNARPYRLRYRRHYGGRM